PAGNEFGVVGIQIAGLDMRLNVLVKDLGGIPRYFHLDHAEIPISPHLTNTKSLIRVLLNLRNVMIVNKSLITQALLENPPRNTSQSTTVSTPDNSMYYNSNSVIKYTKPSCPDVECLIDVESTL
ncbi:15287_t:CDS:2, partial [Rhizophagus irregularis]